MVCVAECPRGRHRWPRNPRHGMVDDEARCLVCGKKYRRALLEMAIRYAETGKREKP
jgi:hypothetical protein